MIVAYLHLPLPSPCLWEKEEEGGMPKMNVGNILKKPSQFTKLTTVQCLSKTLSFVINWDFNSGPLSESFRE